MSPSRVAEQFSTAEVQQRAARLGMWLFLATEILLFAGLFVCYAAYRFLYPNTFLLASKHMEVMWGTVNTGVLITSSLTVALSLHFTQVNRRALSALSLLASLALAGGFLGIKAVEYAHHIHEGSLPGKYYALTDLPAPGASLFFTLYFAMTGLHAVHVLAGMSVLGWLTWKVLSGAFNSEYHTPLELGGLYWHLVDLVWIFLYPLLYLI